MSKRKTKFLAYLFILIIAFIFLFIRPGVFTSLKFVIVEGTSLPIRIISFPFKEMKKMLFYHRTYNEYKRLDKEVNIMKARLTGLQEVMLENSRLEKLLDFKRKLVFSSVAANVVGRDPSNWNSTIILDKGKHDGIEAGMPVVSANGVVGKIAEVSERKAKVILLSDPSFSVAALVKRSREVGLVSGTLQGLCRMRYLSTGSDVQAGDQVISSKLSSSFPEGLLIGEVISVNKSDSDPVIDCIIQPSVTLSQLEEVLVVQKQ